MKNYLTYIIVLVIAVSLNACSVGYAEADKKVAEKACSCFKDVAKQSVDLHDWYSEHSEELGELKEEKRTEGAEWTNDADFVDEGEEMLEKWLDLYEEANDVCYEDFIDDQGDYYETYYMSGSEDNKSPVLHPLAGEFCPEVFEVWKGIGSMKEDIDYLVKEN